MTTPEPIAPIDVVVRIEPVFTMERFAFVLMLNASRTWVAMSAIRKLSAHFDRPLTRKQAWKLAGALRGLALACNPTVPPVVNAAHQKLVNENTQAFAIKLTELPKKISGIKDAVIDRLAEM